MSVADQCGNVCLRPSPREKNRYWPRGMPPQLSKRCEVEETEKAQERSDTLLIVEPLSMLQNIKLTSRATLSRQVCCVLIDTPGAMEPV